MMKVMDFVVSGALGLVLAVTATSIAVQVSTDQVDDQSDSYNYGSRDYGTR
jgi:hypothetical protein